jgi:glycosyltransferase involved in cell wall biosynthesis
MKKSDEKIRVAIVVASLDILGGQAIAALRLLEGLAQSPTIEAELLPINPRLPRGFGWLQRIKYVRTLVTLIAYVALLLIRVPRFDVLPIFSAANFSFLLAPAPAVLIGKLYGKPVILHYHSGEAREHLSNWRRTTLPVLRLADRVVVPSEFLVRVFGEFAVEAEAISNTVEFARFRFQARRPLRPVILANRNFESHYNVACALRAFALVQQQVPEAQLLVAGDGSQRQSLRALAEELQLKNLEFLGAVPPSRMPALYDRADIYLNASVVDNMPLSILEAFACGLAVVTSNAGGIPYVVRDRDNGLVVDCDNHQALAQAVLQLLAQPDEAERLIRRAHSDCRNYSWQTVGDQWLSLYHQLAGKAAFEACEAKQSFVLPSEGGTTKLSS